MPRGYYNYDTRGASAASQIITMERMLRERDDKIEALSEKVAYYEWLLQQDAKLVAQIFSRFSSRTFREGEIANMMAKDAAEKASDIRVRTP